MKLIPKSLKTFAGKKIPLSALVNTVSRVLHLKRQRNRREVPPEVAGDRYVSADEWANFCGVTKRQIFRWISAGHLPPFDFRLGQVRRWKMSTLKKWNDDQTARGRDKVS